MKKIKFIFSIVFFIVCIFMVTTSSYGANDNLVIVKQSDVEYIIYTKEFFNQSFEFAFSNDKDIDINSLTFEFSALDSLENNANNIAYVNNVSIGLFSNTTYMWIKVNDELKASAIEVDLNDNISNEALENVGMISKNIPIELEQKEIVNIVNDEGTKITETVGTVKLLKELEQGEYQLVKRSSTTENDRLFALAELLEKNEFTDTYTKIKASKEFMDLYNKQRSNLNIAEWKALENSTIEQPVEAKNGEQYILWVKGENVEDIHFLTSYRIYNEEKIREEITTKLPHTYDDNRILIALAIVVVAIVLVIIRILVLKKKEG